MESLYYLPFSQVHCVVFLINKSLWEVKFFSKLPHIFFVGTFISDYLNIYYFTTDISLY